MATNSGIEWTDATWNCLAGCAAVSPGCARCYAATMTRRLEAMGQADYAGLTNAKHFNGVVRTLPHKLDVPLRWKKPRRVFVNSMSDLFHEDVPDEFIRKVFGVMSSCGQHKFQILTKRAKRMAEWFADDSNNLSACQAEFVADDAVFAGERTPTGRSRVRNLRAINGTCRGIGDGNYWPLPNCWLGVSVERQQEADERIHWLLKTPAAFRFVSAEPLFEYVDPVPGIDQWIMGCESRGAKVGLLGKFYDEHHFHDDVQKMVHQCRVHRIAPFVKQLPIKGRVSHEPAEWPADLRVREFPQREGANG